MARADRRLDLLKRGALVFGLGLALGAGCALPIGPANGWQPWQTIEGRLRPEVAAPPFVREVGERLRVVTFNLHYAEDVEAIARAIREDPALASLDVMLVQEIRSFPGEPGSRASRLAAALELGYAYAPARELEDGTDGLAIFSRYPLENVAVMQLPRVEVAGTVQPRAAMCADVVLGPERLRVVNVHLDTRLNVTTRILQLRPAAVELPERAIVGGDFNTNPAAWVGNTVPVLLPVNSDSDPAPVLDDYMAALGFQHPTAGFGPTVPIPLLQIRLDSLYLRGLATSGGRVERNVEVSDHWPVWLDLELGGEATARLRPGTSPGPARCPTDAGRGLVPRHRSGRVQSGAGSCGSRSSKNSRARASSRASVG